MMLFAIIFCNVASVRRAMKFKGTPCRIIQKITVVQFSSETRLLFTIPTLATSCISSSLYWTNLEVSNCEVSAGHFLSERKRNCTVEGRYFRNNWVRIAFSGALAKKCRHRGNKNAKNYTAAGGGTGSLSSFAATKPITPALDLQIRSGISILSALQIENAPGPRTGPVWPTKMGRSKKYIYSDPVNPRVEINTPAGHCSVGWLFIIDHCSFTGSRSEALH